MLDHAEAKNENELNKYRRTEAQATEGGSSSGSRIEVIVCTETNNVSGSMPAAAAARSD